MKGALGMICHHFYLTQLWWGDRLNDVYLDCLISYAHTDHSAEEVFFEMRLEPRTPWLVDGQTFWLQVEVWVIVAQQVKPWVQALTRGGSDGCTGNLPKMGLPLESAQLWSQHELLKGGHPQIPQAVGDTRIHQIYQFIGSVHIILWKAISFFSFEPRRDTFFICLNRTVQ